MRITYSAVIVYEPGPKNDSGVLSYATKRHGSWCITPDISRAVTFKSVAIAKRRLRMLRHGGRFNSHWRMYVETVRQVLPGPTEPSHPAAPTTVSRADSTKS